MNSNGYVISNVFNDKNININKDERYMFLMFKPLYLRFAALCAEQILCFMRRTSISFCRRTRKNALFWQVPFYLSTQKNTLDNIA